MKTRIITLLSGALLAISASASAAAGQEDAGGLVVWIFLGFCALIVVGQLLPVIITLWGAKKAFEQSNAEAVSNTDQKEPHVVFEED